MHKIIRKEQFTNDISLMEVEAPLVAKGIKPGQFIVLRLHENGERIPLTMFESDPENGTVTFVYMKVGKSTFELDTYNEGDSIMDVIGPMGKPAEIDNYGTVVCVGGGVGTPEVLPVADALRKAGNEVIIIAGYRTKNLVILEDDLRACCDELRVCTDDGSYCEKGFTTTLLQKLIDEGKEIHLVHTVGPVIMMKLICDITREHGIKTKVSLNPIMLDATGMCGSCRVNVGGQMQLACVDGPEFDGHEVDFDDLMNRLTMFRAEEQEALERYKKAHPETFPSKEEVV
ncbi:sulfide/dihydroorotate dehydrogenase-like FAD/NAD-binding protein [[Eubacterium] cellulosolvens]